MYTTVRSRKVGALSLIVNTVKNPINSQRIWYNAKINSPAADRTGAFTRGGGRGCVYRWGADVKKTFSGVYGQIPQEAQ